MSNILTVTPSNLATTANESTTTTKSIVDPPPTHADAKNEIKGRNVSGRSWKMYSAQSQKSSNLVRKVPNNGRSKSWEAKQKEREERKAMLEKLNEMKEAKRNAILGKKERHLEQEKRRMENEFKYASKSAQTLNKDKVGLTMKAMNKKQLRQIKKTRMNTKTGVVEYVSAYAK